MYALLCQYDRPTVSTWLWVKRQKARRVCTNNKPINKHTYLIDTIVMYVYEYEPVCHLIISTIESDYSYQKNQKAKSAI